MLEFDDIRFAYPGGDVYAVDGVTLHIEKGRHVVLLGRNGSGKSTLVRLAGGFMLPSRGTVNVDGIDTTDDERLRELRCHVGIVLQDPESQIVSSKVISEVAFGPENLGLTRDEILERVDEALEVTGLTGRRDREPHTLSGGEKQRLVIAGILAMRPDYLVLDEPVSMLDGPGKDEVSKVIAKLRRLGTAVLEVTHDLSEVLGADEAVVLDHGRIVFQGRPDELIGKGDELKRWGLSLTPMMELAARLSAAGVDIPAGSVHPSSVAHALVEWVRRERAAGRMDARADVRIHELGPDHVHDLGPDHVHDLGPDHVNGRSRDFECTDACDARSHESAATPLLAIEHVGYEYSKGTTLAHVALRDVSLSLAAGETVLVSGTTGSGKSTLLRLAAGLLEPDNGTVMLEGERVSVGKVGLCYQRPESQLFADTVADDVAFGLGNSGLAQDEVERRVRNALELVELDPDTFAKRSPFSLSGGQARRAALAGIVAMGPRVMLLDEPTVGLDASGRAFVHLLLEQLAEKGTGLIVVSHEIEEFLGCVDEVLLLCDGTVSWSGPAQVISSDPSPFRQAGLIPPALMSFQSELACAPGGMSLDVDAVSRWALSGYRTSGASGYAVDGGKRVS